MDDLRRQLWAVDPEGQTSVEGAVSMDELRARAASLVRGAHPLSRSHGGANPVSILYRLSSGESFDAPVAQEQLLVSVQLALAWAEVPTTQSGPANDAQIFYRDAATILHAIAATLSADRTALPCTLGETSPAN